MEKTRIGPIVPVAPDWAPGIRQSLTFRTSILTAYDGTEQREALRAKGRVALEMSDLLHGERRQRVMADLATRPDAVFHLALRWRAVAVASSASVVLSLSEIPFWMAPGLPVVLANEDTEEAAVVESVGDPQITLATAPSITPTVVYFAYYVRLPDDPSLDARSSRVWTSSMTFSVVPGTDPQLHREITVPQFEGEDLFLDKPNWRDAPQIGYASNRREFDPGFGVTEVDNPRSFYPRGDQWTMTGFSVEKVEELVAFFARHRGRRGAFRAPTWQQDITAAATAAAGSSTLVANSSAVAQFDGDSTFQVVYAAGQVNRVTGIAASGSEALLTMQDAWDQDITPDTKISWCPRRRFATDKIEIDWKTTQVAEMVFSTQVLPDTGGA